MTTTDSESIHNHVSSMRSYLPFVFTPNMCMRVHILCLPRLCVCMCVCVCVCVCSSYISFSNRIYCFLFHSMLKCGGRQKTNPAKRRQRCFVHVCNTKLYYTCKCMYFTSFAFFRLAAGLPSLKQIRNNVEYMAEDPVGSCRIDFALLLQQIKSVRNGAAAVLF